MTGNAAVKLSVLILLCLGTWLNMIFSLASKKPHDPASAVGIAVGVAIRAWIIVAVWVWWPW